MTATRRIDWRVLLSVVVLLAALPGCSDTTAPQGGDGSIILRFESQSPSGEGATPAYAIAALDSIVVRVFRPAPGGVEVTKGIPFSDGAVDVKIACLAENDKRISVELFEAGLFRYHGYATNVDVASNQTTDVQVEARDFVVSALSVNPALASEGETIRLLWDSAPAATAYRIEESASSDFSNVVWQMDVADTTAALQRPPGAHYFRVAPRTPLAIGTPTSSQGAYVLGQSGKTAVTGFGSPEVIPGENVTVIGENLDFPGVQVFINSQECPIVSRGWDYLEITVPRSAATGYVFVYSPLDGGVTYWDAPLFIQRIAYVTRAGTYFDTYKEYIDANGNDTGYSTVAQVKVEELDWRDMSVFDVIIVANDTGSNGADWGAGRPTRAAAIAASGANVLAVGIGGAVYIAIATDAGANMSFSATPDDSYYVPDETASIFTRPHPVLVLGEHDLDFCKQPVTVITMDASFVTKPAGVTLYAEVAQSSNRWALVDFEQNVAQSPVQYFFWGYAGDPSLFTRRAEDCLANVVYRLFNGPDAVPPVAATSDRR